MCFLAADSMDAENQGLNDAKGVLEKLKVTSADRVANVAMQPMFPYEPIFPDQCNCLIVGSVAHHMMEVNLLVSESHSR